MAPVKGAQRVKNNFKVIIYIDQDLKSLHIVFISTYNYVLK